MKVSGEATLRAPVDRVWAALLDPAILVRTIPGCERLETIGDNSYAMTVTVGVAAVRGTYAGTCALRDLQEPSSLRMTAEGSGAPGTIAADVEAQLESNPDGSTTLRYDCQMVVGGMIAGVGQRMLGSVSRRLTAEFLQGIDDVLAGAPDPAAAAAVASAPAPGAVDGSPGVYTAAHAPSSGASAAGHHDFLRGIAVGAGLVTLGVLLGSRLGRRR